MQGVWNVDWYNASSQRAYPLSGDVSRKDVSGSFTIPDDLIVDLLWPVHSDSTVDPTKFHIGAIGVFGSGVTIALAYDGTVIGNVSINASTHTRNAAYAITGMGDFYDTVGRIVIGSLENTLQYGGSFTFNMADALLVPTAIRPDIRGLTSLRLKNGDDLSDPIQGDVVLQAGTNFSITFDPVTNHILLSAVDGAGLNEAVDCLEGTTPEPIRTINGVGPDSGGELTLLGDDCVAVEQGTNALTLRDKCSKPCCGCDELKIIENTVLTLQNQVFSLENLGSNLAAQITALSAGLLRTE